MTTKPKQKQNAERIAEQLRRAQAHSREFKSSYENVVGAGVAWRDGHLKYCIQFDSVEHLKEASNLPDRVEDFPVDLGVGSYGEAAANPRTASESGMWQAVSMLLTRLRMKAF